MTGSGGHPVIATIKDNVYQRGVLGPRLRGDDSIYYPFFGIATIMSSSTRAPGDDS